MYEIRSVRSKLASAAQSLAIIKRELLESQKANYADLQRPDFVWHYLLQSFSTMGGVSGWKGLIGNKANYGRMTFEALCDVPDTRRLAHATTICEDAKVRYAKQKGKYIVGCYERIIEIGGPQAAKDLLLGQPGRDAKVSFLKSFPGIGDKYARNIMMDVYHDDFRDSIAVDLRIQAISTQWELVFDSYTEHEAFYLEVARDADLNGWELDRLMFRYHTVFFPPIADSSCDVAVG